MAHPIHFKLDGEPEVTEEKELTPNFIIAEFGKKNPLTNYLIELKGNGHEKESYQGKGEIQIRIHENMRLQVISTGPTPVSDVGPTGLAAFTAGLAALGYAPEVVDPEARRITFDYLVESGKHRGAVYKLGLDVPADFPLAPPSGPHVKAKLHPTGQSGVHPQANVSDSPFGDGWQYWSRPFQDWGTSKKKTVATYMAHVFRLWDSQ